jgi:hypothetical protein
LLLRWSGRLPVVVPVVVVPVVVPVVVVIVVVVVRHQDQPDALRRSAGGRS